MRAASIAIALAAVAAALFASKSQEKPSGRGDIEGEDYPFSFDPPDIYVPPLPDLDYFPMPSIPEDVFDPRDVLSRRFSASSMVPSEELATWLRNKERFVAEKYELGDGGVTIGYGWFEPYSRAHLMPQTISEPDARAKFYEQLETRGASWVREYVSIPVTQSEFDAMTSMAFNLSPASFKQIADAFNNGGDWKAVALRFTRPGTNLERGLINRRMAEFRIAESGVYA